MKTIDEDGSLAPVIDDHQSPRTDMEALQERERRLRATYEHAGSGIAEIDAAGCLIRVNKRLCELMGRPASDLLGQSVFDHTAAEDVASDQEQYSQQVAGLLDRYKIEKRVLRDDGTVFWASVTSSSVRDGNGRFLYAVRVVDDISDWKRTQEDLAARAREQAALRRFSDQLQRAANVEDVYEYALDAMQQALLCQRGSILLLDKTGAMAFVASRNLSNAYRRAVAGHSPWDRNDQDPQPVCIEDIEQADLADPLKEALRRENIAALAFIPILDKGRLLGKFMAYYDEPHAFHDAEIGVALTLANQLGFGIERMRAREASQQLIAIVESSRDAILSQDLAGTIKSWNRGAELLFGYTAEEAINQPITMLIPPDRAEEEAAIVKRIRAGESVDHVETIRRRKNGSLVDISLTVSPLRDATGRIVGVSKIGRDITERKEAQKKLVASEQRLQDLLAAIPAAIYTTDAAGKITYFNQAAVELAGRTPTLGSDEWCVTWKLYTPDGTPLPHHECPMAISLKEGRIVRGVEAVAERPDGTRVPFIPYPTPMRDAGGNVVGGINMLVDISERKQAETQQRVLLSELNHRVKNNMQMLQSLLSVAARRSDEGKAKQILEEASARLAAMAAAQRVLYDTTEATKFSIPQFLEAVCQTARQTLPAEIVIASSADEGDLPNDAAMPLALIINELLTNAVKHGVNGSPNPSIRVSLSRTADAYSLAVEDNGPGFDFEAVKHKASGLRLVNGLARQLRGTFSVENHPATRCVLTFS